MFVHKPKYSILYKTITIVLVCLFCTNTFVLATPDTLAPAAGNPKVYQEMRDMMEERLTAHQDPIDEFIKHRANTAKGLSSVPYLEDEFMRCVNACGAINMLTRLKTTLTSAGGKIQVIFVKSEDELPVFDGQKAWGHAGTYVTVFALESEKDSKEGRRKIIGRLFHEIRARSTRAKDLFDEELKAKNPTTPEEIGAFIRSMRERFEKDNLQIQHEVEQSSRITSQSLIPEFANLTFAIHPDAINRDYAMAKKAPKLELPSFIPKSAQKKQVFFFGKKGTEGLPGYADLLGSKGAGLATMASMNMPVPAGFTITILVTLGYLESGNLPNDFYDNLKKWVSKIEKEMGRKFGDARNPLLLSVRSGAKFSMPGFLKTITNVGLNDKTVEALAEKTGDRKFAYDTYARFLTDYGVEVLGIKEKEFEAITKKLIAEKNLNSTADFKEADFEELVRWFKEKIKASKKVVPQDPYEQLTECVKAVMSSWNAPEAIKYRKRNNIPDNIGTAVNVQAMVFGNLGDKSATGVVFSRNPLNGEKEIFGEVVFGGQGKDIVSGKITPHSISELQKRMPGVYKKLKEYIEKLEEDFSEIQEVEFTIENGALYILQTRGNLQKVTPIAKMRMFAEQYKGFGEFSPQFEQESSLEELEWLKKALDAPLLDPKSKRPVLAVGIPASPGVASGKVIFSRDEAIKRAKRGEEVIWVIEDFVEFTAKDEEAVKLVAGVLMRHGGATSHPAVVCRGLGQMKPVITGVEIMTIDAKKRMLHIGNLDIKESAWLTLDGNKGNILQGKVTGSDLVRGIKYWCVPAQFVEELSALIAKKKVEREADTKTAQAQGGSSSSTSEIDPWVKEQAIEILTDARKVLEKSPVDWRQRFNFGRHEEMVSKRLLTPPEYRFSPDYPIKVRIIRYLYTIDKVLLGKILSCAGTSHAGLMETFRRLRKPRDFDLLSGLIESMAFFDINELSPAEKRDFDDYDEYSLARLLIDFQGPLLQKVLGSISQKALHNIVEQWAIMFNLDSAKQVWFGVRGMGTDEGRRLADVQKKLRMTIDKVVKSWGDKKSKEFQKGLSHTAREWLEGKVRSDEIFFLRDTFPAGSIYSIFKYLCDHDVMTTDNAISGEALAKSAGEEHEARQEALSFESIKDDIRGLLLHLRLIEKAPGSETGKDARYYVPESVKKKSAEIIPILEQFRGKNLRPNIALLDQVYEEKIKSILDSSKQVPVKSIPVLPYVDFQREIGGRTMPLADNALSAKTADDIHLELLTREKGNSYWSDLLDKYFNLAPYASSEMIKKRMAHPFRNIAMIEKSYQAMRFIKALPQDKVQFLCSHIQDFYSYHSAYTHCWHIYRTEGSGHFYTKSIFFLAKMIEHLAAIRNVLTDKELEACLRLPKKIDELLSDKNIAKVRQYFSKYPIEEDNMPGAHPAWYRKAFRALDWGEKKMTPEERKIYSWRTDPLSPFWQGISDVSFSKHRSEITPAVQERIEAFKELEAALKKENPDRVEHLPERAIPALEDLLFVLGGVEMTMENQYSIPQATEESGVIHLEGAWNPIAGKFDKMDKMDIDIGTGSNFFGITGPNEVGKSTTIEMIALCVLYYQMGLPIPAKAGRMGVFRNIYTATPGFESLEPGESQHTGLVKRLTELIKVVGPRDLVLIDEAHMGSDYKDLTAITSVLMQDLVATGATIVYATHLKSTMKILQESIPHVQPKQIVFVDDGSDKAKRVINSGIAEHSFSIKTLEGLNFPQEIIAWTKEYYDAMVRGEPVTAKVDELKPSRRVTRELYSERQGTDIAEVASEKLFPDKYFYYGFRTHALSFKKEDAERWRALPDIDKMKSGIFENPDLENIKPDSYTNIEHCLDALRKMNTAIINNLKHKMVLLKQLEKLGLISGEEAKAASDYIGAAIFSLEKQQFNDDFMVYVRTDDIKEPFKRVLATDPEEIKSRFERRSYYVNRNYKDNIMGNLGNMVFGRIDYASGIALSMRENDLHFVEHVKEGEPFVIKNARSPLIPNAVPINLVGDSTHPQFIVTGPNKSGKTSAIRTLQTLMYLAQYDLPVPAEMEVPPYDKLLTFFGGEEDMVAGESYFKSVAKQLCLILEQATPKSLVIMDELHGSDYWELSALQAAIIKYLDRKGATVVLNTHMREGLSIAKDVPSIKFLKTDVDIDSDGKLSYHYSISEDPNLESKSLGIETVGGFLSPDQYQRALVIRDQVGRFSFADTVSIREALATLPQEWSGNELKITAFIAELSRLLQIENVLDQDKSTFIFSEKVTFDNGLGVLLPKLVKSGTRVAVIATNDRQRALIDELNQGKSENERIVYADTLADIRTKVHTARYYYFKVTGDPDTNLQGITTFDITEIVKKIIDALGKISGIMERERLELLHEAARKFAEAA